VTDDSHNESREAIKLSMKMLWLVAKDCK